MRRYINIAGYAGIGAFFGGWIFNEPLLQILAAGFVGVMWLIDRQIRRSV